MSAETRLMIKFSTRLGQLVAQMEGFNTPGSLPSRRHNPGDLRHGPHVSHVGLDPDAVGIEPSDEIGEQDMERQFHLDADRGMDIEHFVYTYAPPSENDSANYLRFICEGLGLGPKVPLAVALLVPPKGDA